MYPPIEDHGIIGNLRTAALVSIDGTIDFFCPLRFDKPTLFASLLDDYRGGFCSVRPVAEHYRRKQFYLSDTNVLTTCFLTSEGIAEIADFMPLGGNLEQSVIIRRVATTRGRVSLRFECVPSFNYASEVHDVSEVANGIKFASSTSGVLLLQSVRHLGIAGGAAALELHLKAGEHATFVLTYAPTPVQEPEWSPSAGEALFRRPSSSGALGFQDAHITDVGDKW